MKSAGAFGAPIKPAGPFLMARYRPPSNTTRADSETIEFRNAPIVGQACSHWLAKREGHGFKFNGHRKTRSQTLEPG